MNHGNTSTITQIIPGTGFSFQSQRAERSNIASAMAGSTTSITINGPFRRMPAATAVQNTAGIFHAEISTPPGR